MTAQEIREQVLDSPYEGLLSVPRETPAQKPDPGDWFEKLKAVYDMKMVGFVSETDDSDSAPEASFGTGQTPVPSAPSARQEFGEGYVHDPEKFFAEALSAMESPEKKAINRWYERSLNILSVREADIRNHRSYARVNLSFTGKQVLGNVLGLHKNSYYFADNFNSIPPAKALLDLESDAVVHGAKLFGDVKEGHQVRFSNTQPGEWFYHEAPIVNPTGQQISVFYVVKDGKVTRQDHRGYERLNVHNEAHRKELENFLRATEVYHSFVSEHVYRRPMSDINGDGII